MSLFSSRGQSYVHGGTAPSRTGFHYSEKYCPVTGPDRPPPRHDLLTASFKLTSLFAPGQARPLSSSRDGSEANSGETVNRRDTEQGKMGGLNGSLTDKSGGRNLADAARYGTAAAFGGRPGTPEREREEREIVLHYLTISTTHPASDQSTGKANSVHGMPARGANAASLKNPTSSPPSPDGMTAAGLLAAMHERPWAGRASTGTSQAWREWLKQLEPTLERHLRGLTKDGLAARSNRDEDDLSGRQDGGARFVALLAAAEAEEPEAGVYKVPSSPRDKDAAAAADREMGSASRMSGLWEAVRVMKSRPIKMAKPWR